MIFNLPDYHVIDAIDLPLGGRRVVVRADTIADACPDCGVVSQRVHAWSRQRVRDVGHAGALEVVVLKPRLVCAEAACSRRTFTQTTSQLPLRSRCTTRLRTAMLEAVIDHGRPVAGVAAGFGVSWWTTQKVVDAAAKRLPDVDALQVKYLGIDEHRYRTVRWFKDPDTGAWARVEPWMSTFVNVASGQVLGIVDGRDSAAVEAWLTSRSKEWRARIQVVAIDPSAAFRKAITTCLPAARIAVDPFHLVQLANLCLTHVRQRLAQQRHARRGRKVDPAWAHRMLLLRGYDTLSPRGRARLEQVFATDDPTGELGAAWGVKEGLRLLLHTTTLQAARQAWTRLEDWVEAADTDETRRLWNTLNVWWSAIEVFITSRVTNARTEAANTAIKHIKRTGRGYRNNEHYQARILLRSARRTCGAAH
ncbi:ISL3 family transposase [Raineyella antarctica]|uniref:ISL3 family transposase n=3 Tax=Raineyella antarctica TaxID=1577474 RepID=UPI001FE04C3B|nr:ISL3 family transposase [Raineyella antarctica]